MSEKQWPKCEFDAKSLTLGLDMTVTADVKSITPAVKRIMRMAREMSCASGKEFEIELAVQEALANAVVHGCKQDPSKQVRICVGCDQSRGMVIVVRDPGGGFDPQQIPSPIKGENVYSDHGRGIFLINRLMDDVSFKRGGTEIWMRKG
jgi:serine/threonine-protein kinase RsbW